MIIASVAASLPERVVSNQDTLDLIRAYSQEHEGSIEKSLNIIRRFLELSGLREKRMCGVGERPIDHIQRAVSTVLKESGLFPGDIQCLIYVGIGRGFLEPGNSHMVAAAMGTLNAECFDVVDACQSYIRALRIVDSFFKTGVHHNALIVNAEFNLLPGGPINPANYSIRSKQQIPYVFPSYTIGEAASATILLPDAPDNFEFHFTSRPDLASLCTVPLNAWDQFCHPDDRIGCNGSMRFTSFGRELHDHALPETTRVFRQLSRTDDLKQIFVHSSSKREWTKFSEAIGIAHLIHHTYPWTGNVVSASIPVALADAIEKNLIKKGDPLAFWVGSAGMSFSATRFIWQ